MTEAAQSARTVRAQQGRQIISKGGVIYASQARGIQRERVEDELEKARQVIEREERRQEATAQKERDREEREIDQSIAQIDRQIQQEEAEAIQQERAIQRGWEKSIAQYDKELQQEEANAIREEAEAIREEQATQRGWDKSIAQYDRQLQQTEAKRQRQEEKEDKAYQKRLRKQGLSPTRRRETVSSFQSPQPPPQPVRKTRTKAGRRVGHGTDRGSPILQVSHPTTSRGRTVRPTEKTKEANAALAGRRNRQISKVIE